ncbi:hypothetical protein CANARDRAFT_211472 [[Candida] arabinofermentans NRRL YB-2248]|uniref:Uncharacterized protein n=1 Tax=[Candida] arabinofermentans NRRL YB-2248 TaxID=983967 RepID=A0A1E4T5G6_9ASCO|nr:hypothetical protein CANARDRAFT_211472 [[Candida] arabinofermentans NRRL YB-2248]
MTETPTSATTSAIVNILSSITISPSQKPTSSLLLSHSPTSSSAAAAYLQSQITQSRTSPTASKYFKRRLSNSSIESLTLGRATSPTATTTTSAAAASTSPTVGATSSSSKGSLKNYKRYGRRRSSSNSSLTKLSKRPYDTFDRELLNERIKSFNILTWTITDPILTPLECSINGWKCHSKRRNELHCQFCNAVIFVKLNLDNRNGSDGERGLDLNLFSNCLFESEDEDEAEEQWLKLRASLVESYLGRLKSEHYHTCIWKISRLDTNLIKRAYYWKLGDFDEITQYFGSNVSNLNSNKELILSFRNFDRRKINKAVSKEELKILQKYTNYEYDEIILLLALFGWELKQQKFGTKNLVLLKCFKCTRRILLGELSSKSQQKLKFGGNRIASLNSCEYPPEVVTNGNSKISDGFEFVDHHHQQLHEGKMLSSYDDVDIDVEDNEEEEEEREEEEDEYGDDNDDEDDEEAVDLVNDHETWCCIISAPDLETNSDDTDDIKMSLETDVKKGETVLGYQVALKVLESNCPIDVTMAGNRGDDDVVIEDDDEYTFDQSMALLKSCF